MVAAVARAESLDNLAKLNFRNLTKEKEHAASYLTEIKQRADSIATQFIPLTVEQRFHAFKKLNFRPHGLYVPFDHQAELDLKKRLRWEVGEIADSDERLDAYFRLQDETETWEQQGIPGKWIGQQAIARSTARFRVAGMGRGAGKTYYAAHESLAVALEKPRSTIWVGAPTHLLVSRCFDMIARLIQDFGLKTDEFRNTTMYRRIILSDTGSRIEGVSLENYWSAAGDTVDFALVDEAAQLYPEAWNRAVAPPLARREGQALIISSWEGQEGFFYEQVEKAKALGEDDTWEVFYGETWLNFYQFPQGRDSPAIKHEEKWLPTAEFLEQYGARPMAQKNLIFPEFHEAVHVKPCPFDEEMEVHLAVDPTGGANQYAVAAIQDYGDIVHVIDEYYVQHAAAEDAMAWVRAQEWAPNVGPCIFDSAWPADIVRWQKQGFQAFGCPNKPSPEDRYPIWRYLLRDPVLFAAYRKERLQEALEERRLTLEEYEELSLGEQAPIILQVEEGITRLDMGPEDIAKLRECAHIFFDPKCKNFIQEHKHYAYQKKRQLNLNIAEHARKWRDHLMDAGGYWSWHYKRYEYGIHHDIHDPVSYLPTTASGQRIREKPRASEDDDDNISLTPTNRGGLWLSQMRDHYSPVTNENISILRVVK